MPHLRKRYILANLARLLGFSPLVGVLGHRQVGKTTLLEQVSSEYFSLDNSDERQLARKNPDRYLEKKRGGRVALDECQQVPDLFAALKERVRKSKKPGQFIMSGSVRFSSARQLRESLTGRIMTQELLPLTLPELEGAPLTNFFVAATHRPLSSLEICPLPSSLFKRRNLMLKKYFTDGGLPGLCFIRDRVLQRSRFEEQLRTMLDRDLRILTGTGMSYDQLRDFLAAIADAEFEPLNLSGLARRIKVSSPTLKSLLTAFEAMFLIRILPVEGGVKGPVFFFEDQLEFNGLQVKKNQEIAKFIHFVVHHVRAQFAYQLEVIPRYFQFRTRGRAHVPFCIQVKDRYLGIYPIESPEPTRAQMASVASFFRTYEQSRVVFVHPGRERTLINDRVLCVPALGVL